MRPAEGRDQVDSDQPARAARQPSLTANIIANYASQIWGVLAGIVMMPIYLAHMGAESYGLIGFFTLMNAWFQILDVGLSQTLSRQSARFRAGAIDATTLHALVVTLEFVFYSVAVLGAVIIVCLSHTIAASWLKPGQLPVDEVATAVLLMGLTVPLQWITGLYRGALIGFERQVWLSCFNIVISTLRFGGAALVITYVGPSPLNFFYYQLVISIAELAVLIWAGRNSLPSLAGKRRRFLRLSELRSLLLFSGSVAFGVVVWVLVTQVDKLILSRILTLAQYGVFALAVVAAGGVSILGAPIAQAILPRLTTLAATGDDDGLTRIYGDATQAICVIVAPITCVLAFFSHAAILAWTGNASVAATGGPILMAYALGNGVQAVGAFAYYIQYAKGDLRLHILGNTLFVLLFVPTVVFAALRYGAVGAGFSWLAVNLLYLTAWVPLIHRRLAPGLHWRWLTHDILPIVLTVALCGWGLSTTLPWQADRLLTAFLLVGVAGGLTVSAVLASSTGRHRIWTHALAIVGGRQ